MTDSSEEKKKYSWWKKWFGLQQPQKELKTYVKYHNLSLPLVLPQEIDLHSPDTSITVHSSSGSDYCYIFVVYRDERH